MEECNSKDYSWKWVEVDKTILSKVACDFLYAKLTPTGETPLAGSCIIYKGENANAEVLVKLNTSGLFNCEANPCAPIYCPQGLYVGGLITAGVGVQWRVRDSKEG